LHPFSAKIELHSKTASQKKMIMGTLELGSFKFRGGFEEKRIEAG